jgi:mono/diheme cytochrome c family protein
MAPLSKITSLILVSVAAASAAGVDFQRDIQPLFAEHCYECHGPDAQKGGLSMTTREGAMKVLESGVAAFVPGHPEKSEALTRLLTTDEDDVMPPKKKAKRPTKEQIELLKKWIASGAEWTEHWAYKPVVRAQAPQVKDGAWSRNDVDRFILGRLEREGIKPSPVSDAFTICRRLYLDLTGLPPTPEEADEFAKAVAKDRQKAVEALTDRLLASPRFGERWGRHWLDKARFADSDGYEKDRPRPDAWRYRDWVIAAVNSDMPFDQFTIEQLAGDMLPNATPEQKLATAFHRQTLTNTEGGTDQEQFRNEAVFDRTETTGAVWLGLTVGCARCHTHKYDRISQREYYQLFAFFNNGDETLTKVGASASALAEFEKKNVAHAAKLHALREKLTKAREPLFDKLLDWEKETNARLVAVGGNKPEPEALLLTSVTSDGGTTFMQREDRSWTATSAAKDTEVYTLVAELPAAMISAVRLEVIADTALPGEGPGRSKTGNFVLSEIAAWTDAGTVELHSPTADFSQKGFLVAAAMDGKSDTGWGIGGAIGKSHDATFRFVRPVNGAKTPRLTVMLSQQYGKEHVIGRFKLVGIEGETSDSIVPTELKRLLAIGSEKWTNESREQIVDWLVKLDPAASAAAEELEAAEESGPKPPLMDVRVISQRATPRDTRVLHRGEFLSPTDPVKPNALATLPPLRARDADAKGNGKMPDRLDLARWLVSRENPLTARVTVNHIWAQLFGTGIVRTENDFGVRGEPPSHPELLDWLADEFVAMGWSRKQMIRLLVTSATYQQAAALRPDLRDTDPLNRLLARQARIRVEGEVVRDLHLAASGLLSGKIGGPSVFPPMPPEVAALSYANNFKWSESSGEDRYRRGMYTFFKRTAPHPDLTTFDCPDANIACVARTVSDTPLQALTTLNAQVFADAARALAARVLREVSGDDAPRVERAFRLCLARPPTGAETSRLMSLLSQARTFYTANPAEAKKLIANAKEANATELAAWTAMTRIVMNTDEFITRN